MRMPLDTMRCVHHASDTYLSPLDHPFIFVLLDAVCAHVCMCASCGVALSRVWKGRTSAQHQRTCMDRVPLWLCCVRAWCVRVCGASTPMPHCAQLKRSVQHETQRGERDRERVNGSSGHGHISRTYTLPVYHSTAPTIPCPPTQPLSVHLTPSHDI